MGRYRLNPQESFFQLVQEDIIAVETLITTQGSDYHPDLGAALNILLNSGGKRIRPTITLLVGRMQGAPADLLVKLGAAVELLHTATLVHDDLIDGALLRRGNPTLNAQWSPGATVLTGDFLFATAAKLSTEADSVPVVRQFAETLTTIVNGEINQLFASRCKIDRKDYNQRIYAKTASLFETSAALGSLVSLSDETNRSHIIRFGYEIGMAFQIVDDILDFTGEQARLGKPVGNDLLQGLVTLPTILYAENHPDDPDLQPLMKGICPEEEQLERLIAAIRSSEAIQLANQEAQRYITKGLEKLYTQPDCIERQALKDLAEYIIRRDL
jgi:geranylgeranyl pyrophosphate synthase